MRVPRAVRDNLVGHQPGVQAVPPALGTCLMSTDLAGGKTLEWRAAYHGKRE